MDGFGIQIGFLNTTTIKKMKTTSNRQVLLPTVCGKLTSRRASQIKK
jgi:hypothetical protein